MRTTAYINLLLADRLKKVSESIDVSQNELLRILLMRVMKNIPFLPQLYKSVRYQESHQGISWKRVHMRLEPVFYEKTLDMRRNFKFSVSWLVAFAIVNYLDKIVKELQQSGKRERLMDNYQRNFVHIVKKIKGIYYFISVMGIPDQKQLSRLLL